MWTFRTTARVDPGVRRTSERSACRTPARSVPPLSRTFTGSSAASLATWYASRLLMLNRLLLSHPTGPLATRCDFRRQCDPSRLAQGLAGGLTSLRRQLDARHLARCLNPVQEPTPIWALNKWPTRSPSRLRGPLACALLACPLLADVVCRSHLGPGVCPVYGPSSRFSSDQNSGQDSNRSSGPVSGPPVGSPCSDRPCRQLLRPA